MSKNKYLILSVVLSVIFVAAITYGATTISTNINTAGTLTVSGVSTLTGAVYATSTLQATGVTTLYDNLVVDTDTLFVGWRRHRYCHRRCLSDRRFNGWRKFHHQQHRRNDPFIQHPAF